MPNQHKTEQKGAAREAEAGTILTRGGVNLLNPGGSVCSLFRPPIPVGVLEGLVNAIRCDSIVILSTAPEALG
jgi:hypothetical protein